MPDTKYGDFTFDHVVMLPAGHIRGALLRRDDKGQAVKVEIQLISLGKTAQIDLDVRNAMFLLSVLKAIQLDNQIPFPDDPRVKD